MLWILALDLKINVNWDAPADMYGYEVSGPHTSHFFSSDLSELRKMLHEKWTKDSNQVENFINKLRNSHGIKKISKQCNVFSMEKLDDNGARRGTLGVLKVHCKIHHDKDSRKKYEITVENTQKSLYVTTQHYIAFDFRKSNPNIVTSRLMTANEIQRIYEILTFPWMETGFFPHLPLFP